VKYRGSSGKGYSTKKYIIFYIYTSWSGDVSPASVCITLLISAHSHSALFYIVILFHYITVLNAFF